MYKLFFISCFPLSLSIVLRHLSIFRNATLFLPWFENFSVIVLDSRMNFEEMSYYKTGVKKMCILQYSITSSKRKVTLDSKVQILLQIAKFSRDEYTWAKLLKNKHILVVQLSSINITFFINFSSFSKQTSTCFVNSHLSQLNFTIITFI